MTIDEFTQLVEDEYAKLPLPLVEAFERLDYGIVVDETWPETGSYGCCNRPLKTIFLYAPHILSDWREEKAHKLPLVVSFLLRHEMAHALGMDHENMDDPDLRLTWESNGITGVSA